MLIHCRISFRRLCLTAPLLVTVVSCLPGQLRDGRKIYAATFKRSKQRGCTSDVPSTAMILGAVEIAAISTAPKIMAVEGTSLVQPLWNCQTRFVLRYCYAWGTYFRQPLEDLWGHCCSGPSLNGPQVMEVLSILMEVLSMEPYISSTTTHSQRHPHLSR
jgi:hypothetical protein